MNFVSIETATLESIKEAVDGAFSKVFSKPIDTTLDDPLDPFMPSFKQSQAQRMAEIAAKRYGVSVEDVLGPSKEKHFVEARRYAWKMARRSGWSLTEIGRAFNRDHTTILVGLRK